MDHEDLALEGGAQADRFPTTGGQGIGPVDGARPQLIDVEVARAEVQQRRAELVLSRRRVLLHEIHVLEGAENAVRRALRQPERGRHLAEPESTGPTSETRSPPPVRSTGLGRP